MFFFTAPCIAYRHDTGSIQHDTGQNVDFMREDLLSFLFGGGTAENGIWQCQIGLMN